MALESSRKQNKTKKPKPHNFYFFIFPFFILGSIEQYDFIYILIWNLSGPGGNMGPFFFFVTSKAKDLFCSPGLRATAPETAWHKQHRFWVSFLFQHYPEEQQKTWTMNT